MVFDADEEIFEWLQEFEHPPRILRFGFSTNVV